MHVILATWKAEIRGSWFRTNLSKTIQETPSQPTAGSGAVRLSSQATKGSINRRTASGQPWQKARLYLQDNQSRGMAQTVKCLPSKCEALTSKSQHCICPTPLKNPKFNIIVMRQYFSLKRKNKQRYQFSSLLSSMELES
jgi:hypothetical protein